MIEFQNQQLTSLGEDDSIYWSIPLDQRLDLEVCVCVCVCVWGGGGGERMGGGGNGDADLQFPRLEERSVSSLWRRLDLWGLKNSCSLDFKVYFALQIFSNTIEQQRRYFTITFVSPWCL